MKYIIILADGLADRPIDSLQGLTPVEYAHTPAFDTLASEGVNGLLSTIPYGFQPGSEVANATILGYDVSRIYEGRGPLEAASIGYDLAPDDFALRCNIVTLSDEVIVNHHGGHLTTEQGSELIHYLDSQLGSDRISFIPGVQYRHLLVIKGGNKYVECAPPHDNPGRPWRSLLPKATPGAVEDSSHPSAEATAALLRELIMKSQLLLEVHPFNASRKVKANSIWPWGGGYRPDMQPLSQQYASVKNGGVISAVDLIRGLGRYAGLENIPVEGITGLADTNFSGKARAAIAALKAGMDFVFLHIEACDEAGHDGDLPLKIKAIESIDSQVVTPIMEFVRHSDEPVAVALLPDHFTPVGSRIHEGDPVPVAVWYSGVKADSVATFSERAAASGTLGHMRLTEFMHKFMVI